MVRSKNTKKIVKNAKKKIDNMHCEDLMSSFVNDMMTKDWREMLNTEIDKIRNPKKSKKGGMSLMAAFAIGYLLGSMRR